jgi:serine/threonine-protein kinase
MQQHNPEIEAEIEQVVRKALARDPDERYQNAADLGDALAQFLFSRRMKVTARDISTLVKDTQLEMMRKRSAEPKESLIDALINDEMNKMTSLLEGSGEAANPADQGAMSLDPSSFVDPSNWANDLNQSQAQSGRPPKQKQTRPPQNKGRSGGISSQPHNTSNSEIESLESILEPDRTGVHNKANGPPWMIIIIVMVLLAAGAAVAVVFVMG